MISITCVDWVPRNDWKYFCIATKQFSIQRVNMTLSGGVITPYGPGILSIRWSSHLSEDDVRWSISTLRGFKKMIRPCHSSGHWCNSFMHVLSHTVKSLSLVLWWRHQMEIFSALLALCAGNSPVLNSPRKGQWRGALMFLWSACAWINCWANNREAGDLRRHSAHYDVIVMWRSR